MISQIHQILLQSRPSDLNLSRYAITIEDELEGIFTPESLSPSANDTDRIILIEEILNVLINDKSFDSSLVSPVLSVLSDQIDSLSLEGTVNLTDYFVNIVKRGEEVQPHGFQVLTQLLKRVNDHELTMGDLDSMDIDKTHELTMQSSSKSAEIKQNAIQFQVISTLCASYWHHSIVPPLSSALKDVQMSDELYKTVAEKCINTLSRSERPQDIPVVVKELLVSITPIRVNSFITTLNLAYNSMETQIQGRSTLCDLHESYGLMLLYLPQNRVVCQEIVKLIKLDERKLNKLEVSICIGMMGMNKYQQIISDSLFAIILKNFKDEEKLLQSKLLRMFSEVNECERFGNILIEIAKFSTGWEKGIMDLFVKLGLNLIYNASIKLKENSLSTDPLAKTSSLGVTLVSEIFKHHPGIREHILSCALKHIVNSGKKPYMTLLKTIIRSAPQLVIDSTDRVANALDYITDFPLTIAYSFLDAIQPLIKYSLTLRDTLLLKMRSALLKKKKSSRCIGVYGFLLVLKKFKINIDGLLTLCSQRPISQPFSSSQILVDIRCRPSQTPEANEGLCREVLGILQRCLTQTSEVKQVLYNGFYDVICVNPQLDTPILEMLLDQLKSYIPRENRVGEAVQPAVFRLDMLFQFSGVDFVQIESLPALIASIQLCYLKVVSRRNGIEIEALDDDDILKQVKSCLEMLTQKMCDASLDDFELNINTDFSGVAMGKKNLFIARTLIGVYEALIEYNFLCDEISPALSERILLLFLKCERIIRLLREKLLPQRRSMIAQKETEQTAFTFPSLVYILTSLLSDNNPAHEIALTELRNNIALVRHVFNAATLRLQELQANGSILDSPWLYQEKTFKKAYQLGRVLLRHIYTPIINSKSGGWKHVKGRPLEQYVFESLSLLFSYIQKHMLDCKIKFLVSIRPDSAPQSVDEDNTEALSEIAYLHLQGFQSILIGIFTRQQDRFSLRDTPYILQICNTLHSWMPIDSPQLLEVYEWWHRVCAEQQILDLNLSKDNIFLDNLFSLHLQLKISLSLFRKVAEDIHLILGDIDNETDIDDDLHYKIITSRNVTYSVSMLFLGYLEKVLDDTDWLITKLIKPNRTIMDSDSDQDSPYEALSQRLLTLVATFHHLIQTSFPFGSIAENLPKLCAKLYNTFIKAVKYHLARYNVGVKEISEKFLKVVTYTGTHLEQQMYSFISHSQSLEAENTNSPKGKGKEKEKGKEKDLFLRPTSISKGKLMKQTKSFPNLIFALEQYENFLIQLSKKSKRNLLASFKTSTARDFKINSAAIDASLNDTNEMLEEDSNSNTEEEESRSKRVRQDSDDDESQQIEFSE